MINELSLEEINAFMELLPSGIPKNDDTWCKLRSWILHNKYLVMTWPQLRPTKEQEINIYLSFGCEPINQTKQ